MQRVTRSTAALTLPAPPASPGVPGYFARPDAVAGVGATVPGYEWFNSVQEELMAFLTAAGIDPSDGSFGQVLAACRALFGGAYAVFLSDGDFVVPPGITYLRRVRGWGAAGGGGGAGGTASAGTGGCCGAYFEGPLDVTPGQVIPVTVGVGGTAGGGAGNNGGNGTATSFGSFMTAGGGLGGRGSIAGGAVWPSLPTPAVAVGGAINIPGLGSVNAYQFGSTYVGSPGPGAPCAGGPGSLSVSNGVGGSFPGGAGSGAACNGTPSVAGAGANGLVIVEV